MKNQLAKKNILIPKPNKIGGCSVVVKVLNCDIL